MQIIITTATRGAEDLSARVNDWSFDTRAGVGFTTARVVLDAPERDLWYLLNAASTDTVEFRYAGVLVWQGYIAGAVRRGTRLEITADGAGMRLNDIEVWRVFCDSEVRNWLPDSELPSGFAADNNNRLYIGAGGTIARSTEGQVTYPDDEIVLGAEIVKLRAHALVNVPFGPWIVEIRDDADAVLWTTMDSYDDDLELTVADAEGLVVALRATATVTTIPSQMQAALAGAGAGNLGEGRYGYVVVFVDAHGESAVSQEATLTVNDRTADGQAALSLIARGYSGTTARRLYRSKITPATLTAALAGLGAGTLLNGTYSYAVTFISAGGESSPSGIATVTVVDASTDGQVALTDIPRGPDGTTARRIYRTDADGSVLYLAATLSDNTTTTYTDNAPYSISTTPPDADEAYYLLATVADNTTTTYTDNTADDGLGAALAVDADRATYVRLTEVIVQTLDPATTSAIITALASDAGLDTDGVEESSLTVDRASWQGTGRGTAIREMVDLGDGAVSWLLAVYENDALRLRAWPETATWLLHAAEGAVDIGYDRAAIFNAVRGHLPDGYLTDWQTDVDSITRWGRREKTLDLEQTSQAEAARLAAVYLADHAWPVTGLRIAAGEVIRTVDGSPWPVWRIRAGQVLTLRDVFPYRDVDIRIAETQARPGGVSIIPQGADNRLEVYLAAQERKLKRAAQTAETSVQQGSAVTGGTGGAVATEGDMLKSVYDPDGDGTVASADYATSSGDSAELGGVAAADYLTEAEHTAIGNGAPHHAPVTLDANADTLLSLSTQQVGLDTQAANVALAGPASGAATVPTFRALVAADLPAATEAAQGAAELATVAETQAGTDTSRVVTPAGLRADVPTNPAASRGVRLDASGDLLLPSGGDVLPDGATDVDRGIDKRLRDVSGPVGVGDYGYNTAQLFAPKSWYAGTSAPLDDFFSDNYTGGAIWTAYSGCTPQAVSYTAQRSWLYLRSDYTGMIYPNHAVLQASIPTHATNDYYWGRMLPSDLTPEDSRIGFVVMASDLKKGVAVWYNWVTASSYTQIEVASYNSANAWLSVAGAKTSSIGYTTDWTSRWTGTQFGVDAIIPQAAGIRVMATSVEIWLSLGVEVAKARATSFSLTFTPAHFLLFVEGNLTARKVGLFDWVGRNIIQ